ncbi:MAG: type VI secretion system tip protein TssI/VgrG [Polyangiaceae bacterium]
MADRTTHTEIRLESNDFPCDRLWVRKLDGREAISQLFEFDLEVVVRDAAGLDTAKVAGAIVTILFTENNLPTRRVHGMVARIDDLLDPDGDAHAYRLYVRPRAYRMELIEMLDVYVNVSIADIIKSKLEASGLEGAFDLRFDAAYEKREFICQYKESDLAFVSRWCEHLGISYFFEHTETEDRIIFTDYPSGFDELEAPVGYRKRGRNHDVHQLEVRTSVTPSVFVVQDYNYRTPLVDLSASHELATGYAGGVVEYGAHFKTQDEATRFAMVRAEERQAIGKVIVGESDLPNLTVGHRMTIEGHPKLEDGHLLLVSVEHHAHQANFQAEAEASRYSNKFSAIPSKHTYRSPRRTRWPRVPGVVTGIIDAGNTPGSNDLARIDDQGRYYVRLLFDTAGSGERKASHPIRMAQPHAGPGYGQHFPLRPGVEVIVVFVEGDPDRPVISGAVPNPLNPSPVVAVDSTVNRIRTQSGIVIEMHDR